MWIYERKLQYPVNIKTPNPKLATIIATQLGGPDGELGASLRYLNQRFAMPDKEIIGTLTDIGTEELGHMEMIASIMYQLTRNLSEKDICESPFASYFVDHTTGVYTVSAAGVPFDTKYLAVKGDPIADLNEDLAAEQKARVTYDNILRLADDPDVKDAIRFLRQRELVHYQRFAEALNKTREGLDRKNYYAYNPAFD